MLLLWFGYDLSAQCAGGFKTRCKLEDVGPTVEGGINSPDRLMVILESE